MKIKLFFIISFFISLNTFSQVSDCTECDQCGTPGSFCNLDPRFWGDPDLCYSTLPECGVIPISDNSYILVLVGFSVLGVMLYRKKRKNDESLNIIRVLKK